MEKLLIIFFVSILNINSFSQNDSLIISERPTAIPAVEPIKKSFFDVAWAPIGLSVLSVDLMRDSAKFGLQDMIHSYVPDDFETDLDDWIQYAPIAIMYTADLFKVPSKNTVWNQTKFLVMSELGTAAIVWSLKLGLGIQRPNNGAYTAYPSGHTSQAFVASQVLFNEFRETNKAIAYSGFLFSIPTGALRIVKNKHWVPDVLLGAGIAMLVTNAIYHFEPLKDWNPWKKKDRNIDVGFIPSISNDFYGGHLTLNF